jgi:hypothetical protein
MPNGLVLVEKELYSPPPCPDLLWDLPRLLSSEPGAIFLGAKLTSDLHLVLWLRMYGVCVVLLVHRDNFRLT